jgi:hypothetical protein
MVFIAVFATVSCDFPDNLPAPDDPDTMSKGEGTLTITLPGSGSPGSGRSILPDGLSGFLESTRTFTTGAETKTVPEVTGGTYAINLSAGTWTVAVEAHDLSNDPVGTGGATAIVTAGQRVYAVIVMAPAGTYAQNIYIHNEAELRRYLEDYDGASVTFHLENDITVSGSDPVADYFEGTLDGHGYTINLSLNVSGGAAGLLGTNYGTVKNLRLEGTVDGSPVYGFFSAGAVTAGNGGTIRNVSSTVTVTALNTYNGTGSLEAGGIAGNNWGTIEDCSVGGNVTGNRDIGTGDPNVGGIAGKNDIGGAINRCYVWGNVNTNNNVGPVGGIAGRNEGTVSNCAALSSKVDNDDTNITFQHRVIGFNYGDGAMTNNYAYVDMQLGSHTTSYTGTAADQHGANIQTATLLLSTSDTTFWNDTTQLNWPTFLSGAPLPEPGVLPGEPDGPSPWYWSKTVTIPDNDISTSDVSAYVPALWFERPPV